MRLSAGTRGRSKASRSGGLVPIEVRARGVRGGSYTNSPAVRVERSMRGLARLVSPNERFAHEGDAAARLLVTSAAGGGRGSRRAAAARRGARRGAPARDARRHRLDDEVCGGADEIGDVATDDHLAAEREAPSGCL